LKEALVLFAHGSRDPEWAKPFEKIRDEVSRRGFDVRLAFLERMRPSLAEALGELDAQGVERIRVVPLFLGYGGHLKQDLPALVAAAKPKAQVTIDAPVGEEPEVIGAIAALIGRRA
jgi:sirohydrochlorin cobaltochelatase